MPRRSVVDGKGATGTETEASTAEAQTDALTGSSQRVIDNIMGRLSDAVDAAVDACVDQVTWPSEATTGVAMPVSVDARTRPSADRASDAAVEEKRGRNIPRKIVSDGVRDAESASTSAPAPDGAAQPLRTAEGENAAKTWKAITTAGGSDEEEPPPTKRPRPEKTESKIDGSSVQR